MRFSKKAVIAGAVLVTALAGGGIASLGSSAAVSPTVRYTTAGATSVAGWYAHSTDNLFNFTHIEAYLGSHGGASLENLPAVTPLQDTTTYSDGADITGVIRGINGGVGMALCDSSAGEAAGGDAAQIGVVYIGNGLKDVVYVAGKFGPVLNTINHSNDRCQNGLLSTDPGSVIVSAKVLIAGIPVSDTVQAGILTDPVHKFTFGTRTLSAGSMEFYATDLVTNENNNASIGGFVWGNLVANEADAGAVSNTQQSLVLNNVTVPLPNNTHAYASQGVSELARWAHVKVNGNDNGSRHETRGAFQTPANNAWVVAPVAATRDGSANSDLYLAPSQFFDDNFYVGGGIGLIG